MNKSDISKLYSTASTCVCTFPNHRNNCIVWKDSVYEREIEDFGKGLKTPNSECLTKGKFKSLLKNPTTKRNQSTQTKKIKEESACSYQRLIVLRHGERLDYTFPSWFAGMIKTQKYVVTDLNQRDSLKEYNRELKDFEHDTPLTNTGCVMSTIIGKQLSKQKMIPDYIYSSPALRCLETAFLIRKTSKSPALIRIEPGLYEENIWIGKVDGNNPCMTTDELKKTPFNCIDYGYKPILKVSKLFKQPESYIEYNARIQSTIDKIIKSHEKEKGEGIKNILIVAHASTVDVATGLFSYPKRSITLEEGKLIGDYIPYHSGVIIEKNKKGEWKKDLKSLKGFTTLTSQSIPDPEFMSRNIVV